MYDENISNKTKNNKARLKNEQEKTTQKMENMFKHYPNYYHNRLKLKTTIKNRIKLPRPTEPIQIRKHQNVNITKIDKNTTRQDKKRSP